MATSNADALLVPVPLPLLQRICQAFLEMMNQGARTRDQHLMEDLDKVVERHEWKFNALHLTK